MWLSGEDKHLCWEDGDIQKTIAKGHTASFHLAFSQENITRTQKKHIGYEHCGILNTKTQAYGWRREMHYKIQNIEPKMACVKASLAKNIVHKNGHSWDWLLDN